MVLHEVDTFVHNKLFEFLIRSLFHVFSKKAWYVFLIFGRLALITIIEIDR